MQPCEICNREIRESDVFYECKFCESPKRRVHKCCAEDLLEGSSFRCLNHAYLNARRGSPTADNAEAGFDEDTTEDLCNVCTKSLYSFDNVQKCHGARCEKLRNHLECLSEVPSDHTCTLTRYLCAKCLHETNVVPSNSVDSSRPASANVAEELSSHHASVNVTEENSSYNSVGGSSLAPANAVGRQSCHSVTGSSANESRDIFTEQQLSFLKQMLDKMSSTIISHVSTEIKKVQAPHVNDTSESSRINVPSMPLPTGRSTAYEFSNASLNETVLQQMLETQRMTHYEQLKMRQQREYCTLPKVESEGIQWHTFYRQYLATKNHFNPTQNLERVLKAIKCPEILRMGGQQLKYLDSFEDAMKHIDLQAGHPAKLLEESLRSIKLIKPLKNHSDPKLILQLIYDVKSHVTLTKKVHGNQTYSDNAQLIHIVSLLPDKMKEQWCAKKAKMMREKKYPTLDDLSEWLNESIDMLIEQCNMHNDIKSLQNFHTTSDPTNKQKNDRKENKKRNKDGDTNESSLHNISDGNAPSTYKCWFHKTNGHTAGKCKTLKGMDGKEVCKAAIKCHICIKCGHAYHTGSCKNEEKMICYCCKVLGHCAIFCNKRKAKKNDNSSRETNSSNSGQNTKDKDKAQATNVTLANEAEVHELHESDEEWLPELSKLNTALKAMTHGSYGSNQGNAEAKICNVRNKIPKSSVAPAKMLTQCTLLSVVNVYLNDDDKPTAFLLDSGSSISLIEQHVVNRLKISGFYHPMTLQWAGGQQRTDHQSAVVEVEGQGVGLDTKKLKLHFHTFQDLKVSDQYFDANEMKNLYPYLKELNLISYSKISGIIGQDMSWAFVPMKVIRAPVTERKLSSPIGFRGPLGDYVAGSAKPIAALYAELKANSGDVRMSHYIVQATKTACTANAPLAVNKDDSWLQLEEMLLGKDYKKPLEDDRQLDENVRALEILQKETKRMPNGHYQVPILWKDPEKKIKSEESYKIAIRQWRIVAADAEKKGKFGEILKEITNLFTRNYATNVDKRLRKVPFEYYHPVFFIFKPGRTRMIWNMAKKIGNEALNDNIMIGPSLYNSIIQILCCFREGKYTIKGDLVEMFHQISIVEQHQPALRFVYSTTPDGEIKIGQMIVMPFGSRCSPVCSQFVKNQIATEIETTLPKLAENIKRFIYVDDYVRAFDDLQELKLTILQMREVMKHGGFTMGKLNSNNASVIPWIEEHLSDDERNNPKIISRNVREKLLGYVINFEDDTLAIHDCSKILSTEFPKSKREILSITMSIYDPLGLVMHFTSKLKWLYHIVCTTNEDWDSPLCENLKKEWKRIQQWYLKIKELKFPRYYFDKNESKERAKELWVFTDASKDMLCNVAYVRTANEDGSTVSVTIIGAKSYTVPVNQKRTIPELEWDAIDKGVKYVSQLREQHDIQFSEVFVITDSACCYSWVNNECPNPTIYMKNRLNRINAAKTNIQFIWVPTHLQPADFATKFTSMPEIHANDAWNRPLLFVDRIFVSEMKPKQMESLKSEKIHQLERRQHEVNKYFKVNAQWLSNVEPNAGYCMIIESTDKVMKIPFERFSQLNRLIAVLQMCFRFVWICKVKKLINNVKLVKSEVPSELSRLKQYEWLNSKRTEINKQIDQMLAEMLLPSFKRRQIELHIIRETQLQHLPVECQLLLQGRTLPVAHKLFKFNPMMQADQPMRINTRRPKPNVITEENHDLLYPIVLIKESHLTRLIVMDLHQRNAHCNANTVIVQMHARFFMSGMTAYVKRIMRECAFCKRENAKPKAPFMGDLPVERLAMHRTPFTYVMVDAAGPYEINNYNKIVKRWILVITCLNTRAVHLEPLVSMSAQETVFGLYNAFYLRGFPLKIFSDNGTNFVGAKSIIQEHRAKQNNVLPPNERMEGIQWEFSPARSPHTNGAVERMVKMVKTAFQRVRHELLTIRPKLTDPMFRHYLVRVSAILNDRPLCMMTIPGRNNEFLTPNLLLNHRPLRQLHVQLSEEERGTLPAQLAAIAKIEQILWTHWLKAYVPTILQRSKWFKRTSNIKVGDIVVLADPTITNQWRLGRVTEVQEGSQQQTRKLKIMLGRRKVIELKPGKRSNEAMLREYLKDDNIVLTRSAHHVAAIDLEVSTDMSLEDAEK
jgi:transposase InsO family protein